MIRQCFLANTGIQFQTELLRSVGLDPNSLYPVVKERPPPVYANTADRISEEGTTDKENDKDDSKTENWRMATLKFSPFLKSSVSSKSNVSKKLKKRAPERKSNDGDGQILDLGVLPSTSGLSGVGFDSVPEVLANEPTTRMLTEEEEDLADAMSPVYDQLKIKKTWWILEVLPVRHRIQRADGTWQREVTYVIFFSLSMCFLISSICCE